MPTLLTEERLRDAVSQSTFIHGGTVDSVEGIKLDLHMSGRVLKAQFSQPIHLSDLSATERSGLHIDPGEVVFVLTQEQLDLPSNIMASLTPKRTLAHSGIIVLGGLAVDPGYKGVLWLGLYNVSSTAYPLYEGKKLISALFYELTDAEPLSISSSHSDRPLLDFPEELVTLIRNYKPIELSGIRDALEDTRRELTALKTDISQDKSWRTDLKDAVEKYGRQVEANGGQVEQLLLSLKEEGEVRRREDERIAAEVKTLASTISEWKPVRTILIALGTLLLGVLATLFVNKLNDKPTASPVILQTVPGGPYVSVSPAAGVIDTSKKIK